MAITTHQVRDPRGRLAKAFVELPFGMYRDVPQWVPPFRREVVRALAGRHPFFQHSRGEAYLLRRGNRAVARFMVLEPQRYNEFTGNKDVRLAMPEAIHDDEVWREMFAVAADRAREWGGSRLIGPQGFSPFDGGGVLIEGFEHRASMTMMPWHHRWYAEYFEKNGLTRYKDFVSSVARTGDFSLPEKVARVAEIARKRGGFLPVQPRNRRELKHLGSEIGELYNQSWEDHAEFCPFTAEELKNLQETLVAVADPGMVVCLRAPGGELAGFVLPFPDLSRALQRGDGYLGLRTILAIARERRRTDHVIVNGLGVLPKYRRQGVTAILYALLAGELQRRRIRTVEMTQIAETTDLMLSEAAALTGEVYKRHRVYHLPL
jgi:hypothetical protein